VERRLKAPLRTADGQLLERDKGTPQGGVVSPLLANLFLHYAFDLWVARHLPGVRFARYADDAVLHCKSRRHAEHVLETIRERFQACKLELHPDKTRVVYCQDINRTGDHPEIQFTFLGYTFRPRKAVDKYGRVYVNFSPAVSREALKAMRQTIRGVAPAAEERQEPGRSLGHVRPDPERVATILWSLLWIGARTGVAEHEHVSNPVADAQAQASGGPQDTGRRGAEADGARPTGRFHTLDAWMCVWGWVMGAG
jgi:Reverse transcriptase (RNA-dependent DNA polymerase)